MKKILFFLFLFIPALSWSSILDQTLYINSGYYHTVNNDSFPAVAFNDTAFFNQQNFLFNLSSEDTVVLKVINKDTLTHGFAIKYTAIDFTISPSDSITDTLVLGNGIHIYYDNYSNYRLLGGAGIVAKGIAADGHFFWNIKEHEKSNNESIVQGISVDLTNYDPDYFSINGKSKKLLMDDTLATVTGAVNDTIILFLANTGSSIHSVHFHGYHLEIIQSTKDSNEVGRSKDTFPIYPMEGLVLSMVPDKPGLYPVHDHNLIAVTGNNTYPNGIFIMMDIAE